MGGGVDKLLNLLELVDAEDAARVPAVGPHLLAEAGAEPRILEGQVLGPQPLVAVQGGDGLL